MGLAITTLPGDDEPIQFLALERELADGQGRAVDVGDRERVDLETNL